MKNNIFFLFLFELILSPCAAAQSVQVRPWTAVDLVEVEDKQFRCPENLSTLAEKTQEMERFLAWTRNRYPNWTIEQIVAFRVAVLEHNACTRTINNIQKAAD